MSDESDRIPLEGATDLTPTERLEIRRIIRDDQHARWAMRRARVWVPVLITVLAAIGGAVNWIASHVTLKGSP